MVHKSDARAWHLSKPAARRSRIDGFSDIVFISRPRTRAEEEWNWTRVTAIIDRPESLKTRIGKHEKFELQNSCWTIFCFSPASWKSCLIKTKVKLKILQFWLYRQNIKWKNWNKMVANGDYELISGVRRFLLKSKKKWWFRKKYVNQHTGFIDSKVKFHSMYIFQ